MSNSSMGLRALVLSTIALTALMGLADSALAQDVPATTQTATGVVYHDQNGNGRRDNGEPGLPEVRVSNGVQITMTNEDGAYELPIDDDTILFVIKPRDYMTPVDTNNLPRFYYIHKPNGSPELEFPGVAPTGPLPESVDFPLLAQKEPDTFKALFFGDTQPTYQSDVDHMAHDVIEQILREGTDASFGVTLGDIVNNDLSLFPSMNRTVGLIGIPWYNVIGNHDINFDAADDAHSDETFEATYGPAYYSFDHGSVHFMVLDDIAWSGSTPEQRGRYTGGLGADQMAFIRNDLALIPDDQLIVLMMHIPLTGVGDRQELYRLIEERPYAFSISAHTHYLEHKFIDSEDGWRGPKPHHHMINVTVCGSWWRGPLDDTGIPMTTMRDGAPNGYSILTFDGHDYDITFRAARRPADYQMSIYTPEEIPASDADETVVTVNVFNGSERSTVEMRVGSDSEWTTMQKVVKPDPYYARCKLEEQMLARKLAEGQELSYRDLPDAQLSTHLWEATLPDGLTPGLHVVDVRTTDMHGKTYQDRRIIRIVESGIAADE